LTMPGTEPKDFYFIRYAFPWRDTVQLIALRFRLAETRSYVTYRFRQGIGAHRSQYCLQGPPTALRHVRDALLYLLQKEPTHAFFSSVALQMSDDNGDVWMLERGPGQVRVVKNGQPVEHHDMSHAFGSVAVEMDSDLLEVGTLVDAFIIGIDDQ